MRINPSWSISITISLAIVAGGALAGDGDRRGNNRDEMHEQRQAQRQDRLRDVRAMQTPPQQPSGQQMQPSYPQQTQQPQPQNDSGRRGGRMSPEDRRALRREIDQASHDMYRPGR